MLRVLEEHGCDPSVVIIDFERSVDIALLAVYGPQVQIQYCFYHLTQSIWRQIQSLGLTNMYKDDNEFRIFCGQLDALAFLPLWEVHEGMQYIKQTMPEAAEPLVDYFDHTYVSGRLRQRPQQQHEGWNNKFSSVVGEQHPSVWKLIETLQQECERVTTILLQNERGIRPTKRCKKVYTELQKRLCNLCEDKTSGNKTIAEFLRGVSYNIRGGQPNM